MKMIFRKNNIGPQRDRLMALTIQEHERLLKLEIQALKDDREAPLMISWQTAQSCPKETLVSVPPGTMRPYVVSYSDYGRLARASLRRN
jgi:hypothetical protein